MKFLRNLHLLTNKEWHFCQQNLLEPIHCFCRQLCDFSAFTPAKDGTLFSNPGEMQG